MKGMGFRTPARLVRRTLVVLMIAACATLAPLAQRLGADPPIAATVTPPIQGPAPSYAALGDDAVGALLHSFYAGNGYWRDCPETRCWVHNSDWGSDALTNTLYLRGITRHDERVPPVMAALAGTARTYAPPCHGRRCLLWSYVPLWDSVADSREYALMRDPIALHKAKAAFHAVEDSEVYNVGACPDIRYQRPFGRAHHLKTLETDSNAVKTALLLYGETNY